MNVSLVNHDGSNATRAVIEGPQTDVTLRGHNLIAAPNTGSLLLRGPARANLTVTNFRSSTDPRGSGDARISKVLQYKALITGDSDTSCTSGIIRLLISASRGSSLGIDHGPPVENVARLVNGLLIHVVVSHRHLHGPVA